MYDAAAKRATDIDTAALLNTTILLDGQNSLLGAALSGESTILLFVRNGA